jgi:short-subunit dehydrogenase
VSAAPLQTRRALITGASAGIGEAFAREFARNGFKLVLAARRVEKLQSLAEELEREHGVEVRICACDLLDPGAALGLFQFCEDLEVDVLINNAGVMYHGDFRDQSPSSIDAIVQLNVASLTQLSRLFLEPMLERNSGRIFNVTSTVGFHASPTLAVYSASKGYILSFTEALAEELRDTGVCATAFCPGSTDTQMVVESYGEELRNDPVTSLLMMSTEEVAQHGYKACMSGEIISVPGVTNKILNAVGRMQPRWMNRRMQVFLNSKLSDNKH